MTTLDRPTSVQWTEDERAAWRPPERLTVTQWADEHRWLDPRTSSEPGKYRSARTPYAREWMNCANTTHVREVTIIAGTQLGKTETLNNVVGYAIHQDPGPAMMVLPRNPDVRMVKQRRVMPMIEGSPVLTAELTTADHDVKNVEVAFRRSILYLRSSQSPADLASAPVRYVFADEVDKYPRWSGEEAAPLDLARERTKTFWNSVVYKTTTPTVPDAPGWTELQDGDHREFYMPCPHCGVFDVLRWQNVKWPEGTDAAKMRSERSARYECPHCKEDIADNAKPGMLARGIWIPKRFTYEQWVHGERERDREEHRSYHLPSLYSPWLTWSDMAIVFLNSVGKPEKLQNWTNSWLAEPWEDKIEQPTEDDLTRAIVPGFKLGTIPPGVLVATAGVDVQKDHMWVVVRGWGFDEESWLLFAGRVSTWHELEDVLFRNTWTARAGASGIRCIFIDSRHRRAEIIEWSRKHTAVKMIAGVDRESPLDFHTVKLDKHPETGQPLKHSAMVWTITVGRFKDLYSSKMQDPERWHLPEDIDDDYKRQVTAEHKIRRRVRGKMRAIWAKRPGRDANHLGDCEVYAVAAAKLIRIELLQRRGGEQVPEGGGPPAPPAPKKPRPPKRGGRSWRDDLPRLGN